MINETISAVSYTANVTWNYLSINLFNRGADMIKAPASTPDMLWMLLPLAATLLLMEFYFGRYKEEELGWNTAFGNTIVLIFISIDLFRHLYEPSGQTVFQFILSAGDIKVIVPLWIAGLALLLMLVDFFHFLPKKIAYMLSSPTYVNLIGLLGIIVVYSTSIPLDWTTVFACAILFVIANLIMLGLYYIIPSYKPTISKIFTVDDIEKYGEELNKKKDKK
jgi:hypothetical protein